MAALDFRAMFDEWVAATQKTWGHDRKKTLGGSEAFGCIRKAWYARNGAEKDVEYKDSWGAIRRGDIIENYVVVPAIELAAKTHKFDYLFAGDQQKTFFDSAVMTPILDEHGTQIGEEPGGLSVTPDGLIVGVKKDALAKYGIKDIGANCFLLEIKSIDPRVNLAEEKAIHHGQVQIQMGLVREETAFKPNYAVILYINASFLDDIEVFVVPFDEKKYQIAKDRAVTVFNTEDPATLAREGRYDGSCQYCPFQNACLGTVVAGMPSKSKDAANIPPEMRKPLEKILTAKRAAQVAQKKATLAHDTLCEELKVLLRKHNITNPKDPNAGWSVSYFMSGGRKGLDRKAMEEAGIDVASYEKIGNPFEVLKVTYKDLISDE